jgi:hypothetical protein
MAEVGGGEIAGPINTEAQVTQRIINNQEESAKAEKPDPTVKIGENTNKIPNTPPSKDQQDYLKQV